MPGRVVPLSLLAVVCASDLFRSTLAFHPKVSTSSRTIPPSTTQLHAFGFLNGLLESGSKKTKAASSTKASALKQKLLAACSEDKPDRSIIEATIQELETLSPVTATASSPLLQKKWEMIWTTEKEINFFVERGFSSKIFQTIDGSVLTNNIPFIKGGSFNVTGSLSVPDIEGIRTEFTFSEAALDLAKWGTYKLPPVGKGWFDTLYLDDTLRVDLNSRNDILICKPDEA
ncbi:pap-fibrillin-ii [Phaeodactylum tricornutum CCAP 1055/1]|uniref:Pap-fibrillin-ii n=1 Tax=Phaeodactylum tricornutum (strain CCAP 1055/1) TaxID=556484 RepID=B7GD41_PHATC|nr:pap-fibrillin-ii [Phaeodactylum tricornutum CCAP 1055/1]EEC43432.1 pap-fibrillin-ii [Phaeodactylum tricornutum CCAP 1055/1]|eukprot:XP_002184985.1 pap-fibrillin-ii [Phaeodactylum tricornutum CCAP 1055/1]